MGKSLIIAEKPSVAGDIARALQLWNGGANANYAAEVLSRRNSYVTRGS